MWLYALGLTSPGAFAVRESPDCPHSATQGSFSSPRCGHMCLPSLLLSPLARTNLAGQPQQLFTPITPHSRLAISGLCPLPFVIQHFSAQRDFFFLFSFLILELEWEKESMMRKNGVSRCQLAGRADKQHSESSCCVPRDRGFWLAVQRGGGSWIQGPDIRTLCFSLLRLTLFDIFCCRNQ